MRGVRVLKESDATGTSSWKKVLGEQLMDASWVWSLIVPFLSFRFFGRLFNRFEYDESRLTSFGAIGQ